MKIVSALLAAAVVFAQVPAQERALGGQLAAEFERSNIPLRDPVVNSYVRRVGQVIAKASGIGYPLTFRAIDTPNPVGAALPGGYVYVSSGLITRAEDEAELAAVLAHEIAHIAARHGMPPLGAVPPVYIGSSGGFCSRFETGAVLPKTFDKSAPAYEKEADALALDYLRKAGYDPDALWTMFSRLRAHSSPARSERP
jgi:predicted Zn-dependent protease